LAASDSKLRRIGCVGLILLTACALLLDFIHGVGLGQDRVAYLPTYRLRQSLAIAVSRLHDPAPGGYLAYRSVVDVFSTNGFAMFEGEPGRRLDGAGLSALLNDGPRLDRIIQQAIDVRIDASLPPELIQANELGLADFIYVGFRLFGARISSLYELFFLIAAVSCLLYAWQFRDSPFLLFLLVIFAAEIYFLENYARGSGLQLNTVSNSRLFSGLTLLPALHVLLVPWQRRPPRPPEVAAVGAQSVIFAFLLSCRSEAAWQVALVVAIAAGLGLSLLLRRPQPDQGRLRRVPELWPAALFVLVVAAYSVTVAAAADRRYASEPKAHVFWHEVLFGILGSSAPLRLEYAGDASRPYSDAQVTAAVLRDINARNDDSSPIVHRTPDGKLTFDPMDGWSEYDRLVRSLTLRIVLGHPLAVLETLPIKVRDQVIWFDLPGVHNLAWRNFRVPVAIVAIGAALCVMAGGLTADRRSLRGAVGVIAVVLAFAAVTPLIRPSGIAIGTLFAYLGAIAIAAAYGMALVLRLPGRIESRAERVSSGAGPMR
jgi:hypothetical protein